ncbi:MAG TPA: bifunctional 5,10-methylenetetrahydrofolate dehydrogenase/5,10-methenyltetrahydrofolate cyclohydrolase [Candidatus Paceibacterota bacterium]|nr:bifunctional 5,10-methylenetetrahydrofolate dehydrogenase/5,10-methenyltetrahydrofolate cyclohydrolase [Candidatus Paceibacterota bacterium]
MVIDGKRIAEAVLEDLENAGIRGLTLGILIAGSDAVTDSFVRTKARTAERLGVAVHRETIPETATTEETLSALARIASSVDGIIVQLPLPQQINTETVLAAIPPEKDVDGISASPNVRPPVAEAILEILAQTGTQIHDAAAAVVGKGRLVGKPAAALLAEKGAHVSVIQHGDSLDALKNADIVVLGAGEPGLVTPAHLKKGVVLIDAGTSESSGKIAGDADPACAEIASVFTPVPGGVGPIAVAMIFKNLHTLAAQSR